MQRVEELLDLPEEDKIDPQTGQALVKLRDEIAEKLAWKPGSWYVRRFVRPVYVHPNQQSENARVYVHPMPEAPIPLLQPGRRKTKTARMWVYVGGAGPPLRFFDFTEDRSRAGPLKILQNYKGFVHADAYGG